MIENCSEAELEKIGYDLELLKKKYIELYNSQPQNARAMAIVEERIKLLTGTGGGNSLSDHLINNEGSISYHLLPSYIPEVVRSPSFESIIEKGEYSFSPIVWICIFMLVISIVFCSVYIVISLTFNLF